MTKDLYSVAGLTEFDIYSPDNKPSGKRISYLVHDVTFRWAVEFDANDTAEIKAKKLEAGRLKFGAVIKNLPNVLDRDGGDLGLEASNVF